MAEDHAFRALLAQRITAYKDELMQLDARIAELEAERTSLASRRESAETLYAAEFGQPFVPGPESEQFAMVAHAQLAPGPYTGLSWAEAIAHVLTEAGEPLHVKDIWEKLRDGGFRTSSRDPLRSVVSILVRGSDFMKVGPNRYALGKVPLLKVVDGQSQGGDA
jgi:hypothetical protein